MKNTILDVQNLHKAYTEITILSDINFSIYEGEVVSILGNSGSGKSTLLSIIAGIETQDSGSILWDKKNLSSIPTHKRNFGLLFQNYALFPHLNVFDNIAFGLKMQNQPKTQIQNRVQEVLNLTNLNEFEKRDTSSLSGGEKQRVALARTLAPKPQLLLLDEPISALDKNLREILLNELQLILKNQKITTLYVTHDHEEAFSISDRVIILNKSIIQQFDTPAKIINHPKNINVSNFLGYQNKFPTSKFDLFNLTNINIPKNKNWFVILPNKFLLSSKGKIKITGAVKKVIFKRNWLKLIISVGESPITFEIPNTENIPNLGDSITLSTNNSNSIQFFD
jgi:ABC-type Fe3+/spermidine/putrescine transport system ATPase subunit